MGTTIANEVGEVHAGVVRGMVVRYTIRGRRQWIGNGRII